jgi:hypothetical protein
MLDYLQRDVAMAALGHPGAIADRPNQGLEQMLRTVRAKPFEVHVPGVLPCLLTPH